MEMRVMAGALTGVGNYAFNLLEALVRNHDHLHYAGFGLFSWETIDSAALTRIEAEKNNREVSPAAAVAASSGVRGAIFRRLRQSEMALSLYRMQFSRTVRRQSFDLFHAFNFLPFADPGIPTLPVIYDLSFVRYPEAHPPERLKRLSALPALLERCQIVQTISQFSRNEIVDVYGYPRDQIFVAPPAAHRIFKPIDKEIVRADLATFGIQPGGYLLAVGTLEPRKNLRTLIDAYSRLAGPLRAKAPLVIVGGAGWGVLDLPGKTSAMLRDGSLVFLGSISNERLRNLYQGAIALMYPSIYEGFGMPVVEALACGTAVVHSENTAMDEITNGAAKRLPALDVERWTLEMQSLIADRAIVDESACADRIFQAGNFDWNKSAALVEKAYAELTR